MWANWEYILANTPFLRTVCSRQNAILANFRTQSVRNFQSIKNRRSHCFQVFDTWHKCELCCLIIYLFKKIYYICFLENQQKNYIKTFIAPKPIQNSKNNLVWMYGMIICTFRKFFGKIGGYIPSHFNILSQIFWTFLENRPKSLKK